MGLRLDGDEIDLQEARDGLVDQCFQRRRFGRVLGVEDDPGVGEAVEKDEGAAGVGGDGPIAVLAAEMAID